MARLSVLLFSLAIPGLPQHVIIGGKSGLRLTGDTPVYRSVSNSKRYIVGPSLEIRLPFHFGLEADALYSRLGNTFYFFSIANSSDERTVANSWTFPLLAKYRLPVARAQPFLSTGLAPRHAAGQINVIHYGYYPSDVMFYSIKWHAHDHAWVFGGGIEARVSRLRFTPEFRYLRWNDPLAPSPWHVASYLRPPHRYEAQFLLGIGWAVR
jgi:hypothetical protein